MPNIFTPLYDPVIRFLRPTASAPTELRIVVAREAVANAELFVGLDVLGESGTGRELAEMIPNAPLEIASDSGTGKSEAIYNNQGSGDVTTGPLVYAQVSCNADVPKPSGTARVAQYGGGRIVFYNSDTEQDNRPQPVYFDCSLVADARSASSSATARVAECGVYFALFDETGKEVAKLSHSSSPGANDAVGTGNIKFRVNMAASQRELVYTFAMAVSAAASV